MRLRLRHQDAPTFCRRCQEALRADGGSYFATVKGRFPFAGESDQGGAVVITVGSTHNGVGVELRRLLVGEHYSGVVLVFGKKHRTLDAEIERVVVAGATYPAEPRLVEVSAHAVQLG